MTDQAVHESLLESSVFVMAPVGSIVVERNEKVGETEFSALSVGKRGVTPQLAGVAKSQTEGDRKLVRAGDLVINSRSDRRGASGLANQDGSVSVVYSVMTPRPELLVPEYGHHLFRSIAFQDEFFRWGTGIVDDLWSTNFTRMSRIRVPLPPLEVQRELAARLDEADDMIAKLDELTDALRARAIDTAALFGLSEEGSRRGEDAQSPLSGTPEHWDRTKFGYDFTESTERNGENPPGPLLSISEYRGVELNTRTDGQQASLDVAKYRVVRPNQLAANMMWLNHGGLGVSSLTGYISPDYKAFWISPRFHPRYVHHLLRSPRYVDYFGAIGTGVRPNAQRVTKTALDMMPLPLPPMDEQQRIADHLDEVTGRIDGMLSKIASLRDLLVKRSSAFLLDVVTGRKEVA
ncbi:restriction modification system DNA specificity domain-containing protein [Streptomyces virginiae]|uniref:Restriction modification system DNA specificity domain-containing protein n=1 Tax=Streptomyces virginiae TaxID=1961 RepID=A0ABQ3NUV7_STRVG|nr:restriction endonuclease subunit S [Streptomyces virginiae]MBP2345085.1 type I restriction enzyme S subunit [Streptomyces virginiae]GGP96321.1 restriction modification system DNA specificity domain-containing protein [Streptomyces virginiae]GHI16551.1 restriction modification system DNA specificity domain-containing protein [Streptomyces virginiae]